MNPNSQSQQPQGPQQDELSGPTQNPFAGLMAKMQGGMGGQSMMGGQPQDEGSADTGIDMETGEPTNQLLPGSSGGDSSEQLIPALKSLQGFLTASTDQKEIAIARQIIVMLTQLIQSSQSKLAQRLPQDQNMLPQHQEMLKRAAMAKKVLR